MKQDNQLAVYLPDATGGCGMELCWYDGFFRGEDVDESTTSLSLSTTIAQALALWQEDDSGRQLEAKKGKKEKKYEKVAKIGYEMDARISFLNLSKAQMAANKMNATSVYCHSILFLFYGFQS